MRISHVVVGLFGMAALTAGMGCEEKSAPPATNTPPPSTTPAPDNTEKNKADRDANTKTPFDQKENSSDVKITAEIRRAILAESGMSTDAQNCKIITENGVVTLRGPVRDQAEKDLIDSKAKAVAGVTRVDNQLEIKAK